MKVIKVVFSFEAKQIYDFLNKESMLKKEYKIIFNAINKKIDTIKQNVHYGNPISKTKIPIEYKLKYDITNLFRVELPSYWRMLYTLSNSQDKIEIIAFILEIINHKQYNKRFKYRDN